MSRRYCEWDSIESGRHECIYPEEGCNRKKREDPYGKACQYFVDNIVYCKKCDNLAIYTFNRYESWSEITFENECKDVCSITCALKNNDYTHTYKDYCPRENLTIYKLHDSKFYLSMDAYEANIFISILTQKPLPIGEIDKEKEVCIFCGKTTNCFTYNTYDEISGYVCNNIDCLLQLSDIPNHGYLYYKSDKYDEFYFEQKEIEMLQKILKEYKNEM